MRIGLDVIRTLKPAGINRVTDDLVAAVSQYDHENDYVLFTDKDHQECWLNLPANFRVVRARLLFKKYLWNQTELPWLLHRERIDLFYSAHNCCAPGWFHGRVLVTIHDLIPLLHNLYRSCFERWAYLHYLPQAVRRADHIVTDADYTRRLIAEHTSASVEDITVVPLCVRPEFAPPRGELTPDSPLHRLPPDFLLGYNSRQPLKNTSELLTAFARYRRVGGELPMVLFGSGFSEGGCCAVAPELTSADALHVLGVVSDAHLRELYGRARVFIFPSRCEGFGLPVLEAMACGCPVITSNATSVPEVAGEAAVLLDPDDPDGLAAAMMNLVSDKAELDRMRRLGMDRARSFSRERYAQNLLAVFERVARS